MTVCERLYCRFCNRAVGLCWTEVVPDSEGNVCPCYVASDLPLECPQCFDPIDAAAIDKALEKCDFAAAGLVVNPADKDNPNNLGPGVVHLNGGECLLGSQLYYPRSDDVPSVQYPFTPRARVEAETGPYDESVSVPKEGAERSHVLYREDFQLGGVPPLAGENALPLPPFADRRHTIYREELQVCLPPKYGCLRKGPDLPSIGEEPIPHKPCAVERGFDGVPDIEAGESMFPPVPPSVAMNPLSCVTSFPSLCPDAVSPTEVQSDVDNQKQQQQKQQEQEGGKIEQSTTIPIPYADLLPERRLPLPQQNKAQQEQHSPISFGYGNNLQAPPFSLVPLPQNHQPTETVSSATLSPFSYRPSQDPHTPAAAADNTSSAFSPFGSPATLSAPGHTTSQENNSSGHAENGNDTDDRQSSREIDSATPTIAPVVVDVFPTQQTVEITEIPSPSANDEIMQDDEPSPTPCTTHQTSTTPMPGGQTEPPPPQERQEQEKQQPKPLSSTPDNDVHEASGSEYDPTAETHSPSPAARVGSSSPHPQEPGPDPGPTLETGEGEGVSPSASFQTDETASGTAPPGSARSGSTGSGTTRRPRKRARLTVPKYAGKRKGSRT